MAELSGYEDQVMMYHHSIDLHPNPADFEMHTHDRFEIYLFLGGKGVFWVEGNQYPLSPGDMIITRPFEAHCIAIDPNFEYERIAIHFHPSLLEHSIGEMHLFLSAFNDRDAGKNNLYHADEFESRFARDCIDRIVGCQKYTKENFIAHLYPLLFEIHHLAEKRTAQSSKETEPLSYRILQYINQNITTDLSLEEICKEFYISKSQLCRIFKRSVGSTVWHYITVKRLMLARQLLSKGIPPSKVSALCGFSDYSVFWRAYRSEFGVSPKKDSIPEILEASNR